MAAAAGGILYFIGFIVSCLHYARYGVLAIDFVSPYYVLVGGLCFASFAISIWIDRFARVVARRSPAGHKWQRRHWLLKRALDVIGFVAPIFGYFAGVWGGILIVSLPLIIVAAALGEEIGFSNSDLSILWQMTLLVLLARAAIFLGTAFAFPLKRMPFPGGNDDATELILSLVGCALMLLVYISVYALCIHNRLPASIGGGKFTHVELYLSDDKPNAEIRRLLKLPESGPARTTVLPLIRETSESYYLLTSQQPNKTLMLPRSAVSGSVITYEYHKSRQAPAKGPAR
jgi:hypothetical protein